MLALFQRNSVVIYDQNFQKTILGNKIDINLKVLDENRAFTAQYTVAAMGQTVQGTLPLNGNTKQTIERGGLEIYYEISGWTLSPTHLSFHLKVQVKKVFWFTVLDTPVSANLPSAESLQTSKEQLLQALDQLGSGAVSAEAVAAPQNGANVLSLLGQGGVIIYNRDFTTTIVGNQVKINLQILDSNNSFTAQYTVTAMGQTVQGTLPLNGNTKQTIHRDGAEIYYEVSRWSLTPSNLSFHLKVQVKKVFWFTVLDTDIAAQLPHMASLAATQSQLLDALGRMSANA
jgi:guanyl-specific ribonuclease Sa